MIRSSRIAFTLLSWALILGGAITAFRSVATQSLIIATSLIALGLACLEVMLFVKPGINGRFVRPVGQMVIATGLTLLLNAIPLALLRSATNLATAAAEQARRFQLSNVETTDIRLAAISSLAVLLLAAWTVVLPVYAWWRWFDKYQKRADA